MTPRLWLITAIAAVLIAVLAVGGVNIAIDPYGLYRSNSGRQLRVAGDERVAKYLLSLRYVPQRFNSVLIGASISANWDVTKIDRLRIYNESLNGATIIEERALIEAALSRPGISIVLLLVHPALTYSSEFRTVDMQPALKRSALGSLSLWEVYKDWIRIRLGGAEPVFDYAGTERYAEGRHEMNANMKRMWNTKDFEIDPVAWQAYIDVVGELRHRKIQIVFIVPPTSAQLLSSKRTALERYLEQLRAAVGAGDAWIDFLSPPRSALWTDEANFSDGVHFTPEGARAVVNQLNAAINDWLERRQLIVDSQ